MRLEQLVADALPASGAVALSGSMLLGRSSKLPPFVVHVKPMGDSQPDYGARPVAALVLIVEPGQHRRIDPDLVARTLRLTPAESQVAVSVGRRQKRARDRPGDGAHRRRHLLAPEADLPQTADLPAGGPGAVGAVDRRIQIAAPLLASSLGAPNACRLHFSQNPATFLQILPILVATVRH